MEFITKTLEQISIAELANSFNTAFADYFVRLHMTEEMMQNKIQSENIQLNYSVGIFIEEHLVGFILTGIDEIESTKTAYNAGTGVWPAYRGNRFTEKMYQHLNKLLVASNIYNHQLEVLLQNGFALKVYTAIGFNSNRNLNCYRGNIDLIKPLETIPVTITDIPNEAEAKLCWNYNPAWQNSYNAILRTKDQHLCFSFLKEGHLVGYLVFAPATMRVKQFGVHKEMRNRGVAKALFSELKSYAGEKEISIINIDADDIETNIFLEKIGLSRFAQQIEMKYQQLKN